VRPAGPATGLGTDAGTAAALGSRSDKRLKPGTAKALHHAEAAAAAPSRQASEFRDGARLHIFDEPFAFNSNRSVVQIGVGGDLGKYPPAEPRALRFEPLNAAVAASHATLIRLIASPTALERTDLGLLTRAHEPHIIHPAFRVRSLRPISLSKLASALAAHDPLRQAYSWKCQTATATPAEPEELPLH
jgi:hypothetical protein